MVKDKTEYIPVTVRGSIKTRITDFSAKTGLSRSKLIDISIEEFLKKYEGLELSDVLKSLFK